MFKNTLNKVGNYLGESIGNISNKVSKFINSNKNKVRNILLAGSLFMGSAAYADSNKQPVFDSTPKVGSSIMQLNNSIDLIKDGVINVDNFSKVSVIDFFEDLKLDSNYKNRKAVFGDFFEGENYRGTSSQNMKLIKIIKEHLIQGDGVTISVDKVNSTNSDLSKNYTIKKVEINNNISESNIKSDKETSNTNSVKKIDKPTKTSTISLEDRFKGSIAFKKYNRLRKTNPESAERFKSETMTKLEAKWGKNMNNSSELLANRKDETKKESKVNDKVEFILEPELEEVKTNSNASISKKGLHLSKINGDKKQDIDIISTDTSVGASAKFEEKGNYRLELSLLNESSETSVDDILIEGTISMLYSGKKLGTYIGVKKGSNLEKFLVSQSLMVKGNKVKLTAGLLEKVMNFNFNDHGKKDVGLKQLVLGAEHTYYNDKNSLLHELVTSVVYYDINGEELGVIGNIIVDNTSEYDWTEVNGGVRGGSKLLAEFKGVFKINDKTKFDLSGGFDQTNWDKMYNKDSKSEFGARYGVRLTHRFNDYHQVSGRYNGSTSGFKETALKYDYNHGNGFSGFAEAKHLDYNGARKDDNKILAGIKYSWGGVKKNTSKIKKLFSNKSRSTLTLDDLKPSNLTNTDEIQVFEKVIWNNHIVYVNKSTLGTTGYIEKNSDNTLKSVNLDTGVTNLVSIEDLNDIKYLPYLTIISNQYVRVTNFKSLNDLMGSEGLKTGDTKVIRIKIKDSNGTFSAYELTLTKGSVEFRITPLTKNGLIESEVDSYINGNKTINQLDTLSKIGGIPGTTITEGSAYSFIPTFSDSDGDTPTFSITNKPDWATFNATTGELSGTPGYDKSGSYKGIVISATVNGNTVSLNSFNITVSNTDQASEIGGTPGTTVAEGSAYLFVPTFSDADGDTPTFSITNKPDWATFNTTTGELSGTPGYDKSGSYTGIIISATANGNTVSLNSFNITVSNTDLPEITSMDFNAAYSETPDTKNKTYTNLVLVTNTNIKSIEGLSSPQGGSIQLVSFVDNKITFNWTTPNDGFPQIVLTATALDNDQTTINNFYVDLPN